MNKYYVDPKWCLDNHEDAAKEMERLHKWCDDLESQGNQLRRALQDAMRYFDQVIIETGYQSEGERITHDKARAALKATEEGCAPHPSSALWQASIEIHERDYGKEEE